MITEADLRNTTWSFRQHATLPNRGSMSVYQCDQHPGLTIEKWRPAQSSSFHRYFYDGTEVAGLAEAADLLNRKAETQKGPPPPAVTGEDGPHTRETLAV